MHVQAAPVAVEQLNEVPSVAKPSLFKSAVSVPPSSVAAERGCTQLPLGALGKDRGNSSQQTARAGGARASRKSGTLAQMTDERRESNGTLTKGDRATPPGKLQQ